MVMLCKICGTSVSQIFSAEVLNKYSAQYFHCIKCGFIQTSEPVWLEEAYKNPINLEDTGLLKRNILFAKRTAVLLYFLFDKNRNFLDFAGGYGIFVRLMRDKGFNFYWADPYTENIFARGFEYKDGTSLELVTSFESFEHFTNPMGEIDLLLAKSPNLLFSTELYRGAPPKPEDWDFYGFSHGQHLGLYSEKTLHYIANKHNLNLCTNKKSFHLFTEKKISNKIFNLLLKLSLSGLSEFVTAINKDKTKEDSRRNSQARNS